MPTLKAKTWTVTIAEDHGVTYVKTTGATPKAVKDAAEELCKCPVTVATATRILKTQFGLAIVAVED